MKYLSLAILMLPISFYAMDEEIPLLGLAEHRNSIDFVNLSQSSSSAQAESDEDEYTLDSLDSSDWKKSTTTLDLSHKQLSSISGFKEKCIPATPTQSSAFPYEGLATIILTHNKIKKINLSDFSQCAHLQHLDLSYNPIKHFEVDIEKPLPNLRSLNLSHNTYKSFASCKRMIDIGAYFVASPSLKHIDLSYNGQNITEVRWSQHPVWSFLKLPNADPAQLPTINLIGNTMQLSDRQWLIERYQQEKKRFQTSLNDSILVPASSISCGVTSILPAVIFYSSSSFSTLAVPLACISGIACGLFRSRFDKQFIEDADTHNDMNMILSPTLPLYFDEQDNQQIAVSDSIKEQVSFFQWRMCH